MKKGTFIWTCIGAGLVIIVLVFFNFKREKIINHDAKVMKAMVDSIHTLNNQNNGLTTKLNTCQSDESTKISNLNNTVSILTDSIDSLNVKNEQIIKALKVCESGKKAVAKKPTVKKPIVKKPVVKPAIKVVAPKEELRKVVAAKATEPEPIVAADPLAPLRDGNEEILACLRVNGSKDGHFPHYAKDRGATVSNAKDNGRHGYNYVLTPVESISGNVPGVTKDGTFFVPAIYLKKYLNMSGESLKYVDLLYKGNWSGIRMTLQGEYYVFDSTK